MVTSEIRRWLKRTLIIWRQIINKSPMIRILHGTMITSSWSQTSVPIFYSLFYLSIYTWIRRTPHSLSPSLPLTSSFSRSLSLDHWNLLVSRSLRPSFFCAESRDRENETGRRKREERRGNAMEGKKWEQCSQNGKGEWRREREREKEEGRKDTWGRWIWRRRERRSIIISESGMRNDSQRCNETRFIEGSRREVGRYERVISSGWCELHGWGRTDSSELGSCIRNSWDGGVLVWERSGC